MYHYAGNNPVKYTDPDGEAGELAQIWQGCQGAGQAALIVFVGAFALSVATNPELRQELSDVVENACTTVSTAVNNAVDTIRANVEHYNAAKTKANELTKEYTDKKSTGSYTITFESGKTYSGKGGIKRAVESAAYRSWDNHTMPISIDWTSALTNSDAFEDEYIRIQDNGGPMSRHLFDRNHPNYNKIQSPGETIYLLRHGELYPEKAY